MKEIEIKKISYGLLGFVGVQACAVSASLAIHYSQSQITPIVLTVKAPRYSAQDILYGAIMKPQLNVPADPQSHTKEFRITLVGSTTGSSRDSTLIFTV